ncbi:MAG: hypothetical protein M0Z98_10505 [Actinomycetales bacterium]|nr:hypothetical protein [Actinomycetales bacterium]
MLGQIWSAAVWLSCTVVVVSLLVVAVAWRRTGLRGAMPRRTGRRGPAPVTVPVVAAQAAESAGHRNGAVGSALEELLEPSVRRLDPSAR